MPIISGGGSGGGLGNVTLTGTPASGQVPVASAANAAAWGYPPGFEIGYDQITASVNIAGTTSGTATTIITSSAYTFDGTAVYAEFFAYAVETGTALNTVVRVQLNEGATVLGVVALVQSDAASRLIVPTFGRFKFTPSAGSHTYSATAYASVTTGTPAVDAGAAGANVAVPAYLRFVKV